MLKFHTLFFTSFFVLATLFSFAVFFTSTSFAQTLTSQSTVTITALVLSTTTPPSSGGGGGGGGGGYSPALANEVIFRGIAYPGSDVSLIKDGQLISRVSASPNATFELNLAGISAGTYTFGVYAEDVFGLRSITETFTAVVTNGAITLVSGIFLPPTISADKLEVKQGDILTIIGRSVPEARVSININSDNEIVKKTSADSTGNWVYKFDTSEVEKGDHVAQARASKDGDFTDYSGSVSFKVGSSNVLTPKVLPSVEGDANADGKVNLVDFSLMAYWYKRPLTPTASKVVDLNHDGKVDIVDFSILAYYWTG